MRDLTQNRLKDRLDYDPETGIFKWLKSGRGIACPGSIAGSVYAGYRFVSVDGSRYAAHRLAFLFMTGEIPDVVDHINGNGADNSWNNLRGATQKQNTYNSKISRNNKSRVKGVHWCKRDKRWIAQLQFNGKMIRVGYFYDLIGAELAVRKARIELHGEFANHG